MVAVETAGQADRTFFSSCMMESLVVIVIAMMTVTVLVAATRQWLLASLAAQVRLRLRLTLCFQHSS